MNTMATGTTFNQPTTVFSKVQPWLVVLISALFFFFIFVQLTVFNTITPFVMKDLNISVAQTGAIAGGYFYAVLVCFFPAGIILDHISTKKIQLFGVALATIATYAFSTAGTFWTLMIARMFVGVAGSLALISCIKLASRWFPPQKMALVIGLIVTFAMLGGMTAQTPMTLMAAKLGWRGAVASSTVLGIITWLLILITVRDYPAHLKEKFLAEQRNFVKINFWATLWQAIKNGQTWLAGAYTALVNLPIFLLGSMGGTLYLIQIHNFTNTEASLASSMLFVGAIIGSPLAGYISDTLKNHKKPMFVFALLSFATLLAIMYIPDQSLILTMALFFLIGLFTSGQVIGYPVIAESNPLSLTGTATGIASILILSGGLMMPVFGWLLGLNWDHKIVNGVQIYSKGDFMTGMMIMVVGFVLSLVITLMIKETHCQPYQEKQGQ